MSLKNEQRQKWNETLKKLELVLEVAKDGFFCMESKGDTIYLNPTFYKQFNLNRDNHCFEDWLELIHPEDRHILQNRVNHQFKTQTDVIISEYRVLNHEGQYIWVEALGKSIHHPETGDLMLVGYHSDISERKRNEEDMKQLAYYDPLTGVYNRNKIGALLEEMMQKRIKAHVVYIDINNFKAVNAMMGYETGDAFLHFIAKQLKQLMPATGLLARNYGDEFIAILPSGIEQDVEWLVHRLQTEVEMPSWCADQHPFESARICAYELQDHDKSADQIIHKAHLVVAYMKANGLTGIQYYNQDIEDAYMKRLTIEKSMQSAIANQELRVVFQPIINNKTMRWEGVEALLRWHNESFGEITPTAFIPMAENNGLIQRFGQFVVEEVCELLKWFKAQDINLSVSINVSPYQLSGDKFEKHLVEQIQLHEIPAEKLIVEITESAALEGGKDILDALNRMKETGVQLAIDDFGTGYSSLHSVVSLPVDIIKIDRSLLLALEEHQKTRDLIELLAIYSQKANYKIVAEGVENQALSEAMIALGIDFCQGYYFSKPLELEDLKSKVI